MKIVPTHPANDLRTKIKYEFAKFNKDFPRRDGRRYPAKLKALVELAIREEMPLAELRHLTGMSNSSVHRLAVALRSSEPAQSKRPKRLEVVDKDVAFGKAHEASIHLPSGVKIDLKDTRALSELMPALLRMEVSHVTSC